MTHLIHRLNLEFNSPHQGAPLARLKSVSDWANSELIRRVEGLVETWPRLDEDVQIEQLDLHIELQSWDDWEVRVTSAIEQRLENALRERLAAWRSTRTEELEQTHAPSGARGVLQALAYYLQHGQLPWYHLGAATAFVERVQVELRAATSAHLVTLVLPALSTQKARARLVAITDEPLLRDLVQTLLPRAAQAFISLLEASLSRAREARASTEQEAELRRAHWLALFEELSVPPNTYVAGEITLSKQLEAVQRVERQVAALGRAAPTSMGAPLSQEHGVGAAQLGVHWSAPVSQQRVDAGLTVDSQANDVEPQAQPRVAAQVEHYIHHAGLILLAPYLPTYLMRLGLAEPKRILNLAGALVAVHHLATGSTAVPQEFELTLARLLCGQEEQDLPLLSPPDTSFQEEGNELLRSVIEHWSALKKTSPEGLREAFLSRPGKLVRSAQGSYRLLVEQAAYDILLGSLPWSFRTVQLPWMPHVLRTEWAD